MLVTPEAIGSAFNPILARLGSIFIPPIPDAKIIYKVCTRPEIASLAPYLTEQLFKLSKQRTYCAMPDDQQKCIDAGANDYMAKPIDVDKLLSLVRVWMPR